MLNDTQSTVTSRRLSVDEIRGGLASIKRAGAAGKAPDVPASDDPVEELRVLVRQHAALCKASLAMVNMTSNKVLGGKKNLPTEVARMSDEALIAAGGRRAVVDGRRVVELGDAAILPCRMPFDARARVWVTVAENGLDADKLERKIGRQLRLVPIYDVFLKHVFGCGPIVAAYLASEVRIDVAEKPSSLKRFCGLGVVDGRAERRTRGSKNAYNAELKMRLYQMLVAMRRNGSLHKKTTKYLRVWDDYLHRATHAESAAGRPADKPPKGSQTKGRRKATDAFLDDLYLVWKAVEGLPAWPTYRAAFLLGYHHGGEPCDSRPRVYTVEEALAIVGDVGGIALSEAETAA